MPDERTLDVIEQLNALCDHLDELAPPIRFDELSNDSNQQQISPNHTRRSHRQLVAFAAAGVVAVGAAGLWWAATGDTRPAQLEPADAPAVSESLESASDSTVNPPPASIATGSVIDEIAQADPWRAAQLFQIDARYQASPAEAADLTIANELLSRECYEDQGVDTGAFDPGRLDEWERFEQNRWDLRRMLWTPDGQNQLRQKGFGQFRTEKTVGPPEYPHFTTPAPEQCDPATTAVTPLGSTTVESEEQLTTQLIEHGNEWAPVNWGFGRLPGTEAAKAQSDQCMLDRGWAEWTETGAYRSLYTEPEVSDTEIALVNDFIDCNEQADAASVYVTSSADYVTDFRLEFADQLEQIAKDRVDSLRQAHGVLRAAGLDPLSD